MPPRTDGTTISSIDLTDPTHQEFRAMRDIVPEWFTEPTPLRVTEEPLREEPMNPARAKTIKKERHLTRSERQSLHHPPKDKNKLVDLDCSDLI